MPNPIAWIPGSNPLVPDEPPCQDCDAFGDVHYLKGGGFILMVHHAETCPRWRTLTKQNGHQI